MNPQSKFKISSWTWNNFVTSKLGFETQWTITCFELRSDSPNQCTLRTYWTPFRKSCKYTLQKYHSLIETTYPKIATNFQSLYLAEIFALLLWNLSWWLLLPSFRFSQIFIIFRGVVLEICDSSFLEFRKIGGPYMLLGTNNTGL